MVPTTNDEDVLKRIETKLDQMLRLAALWITTGQKQVPAIQLLASAGFDRKLIAEILHTTPNTVSVTLSKKKAKKSSKPGGKEAAS
jgi:hypothetical protein